MPDENFPIRGFAIVQPTILESQLTGWIATAQFSRLGSDWHSPGEPAEDSEFELLLCTGGPAVRILGELEGGAPRRASMECQDWFTSWTEVRGYGETIEGRFNNHIDEDVLIEYASIFYFGD